MNELTEKRTPELIGAEIRMYYEAGRRVTLLCGIEIGRRLVEAKELLQHGEWLPWLERETAFSDRHAQRYMKLFKEYGAAQLGLFGPETNATYMSDFPISKAIALLSVPESERIEFAEEVDAEHISVRELEQAIKERDEKLEALRKDMDSERKRGDEAIREKMEADELLKTQDKMLTDANARVAELTRLNKELEERPVEVAVETVRDEAAIEAAAKAAREKAEAEKEKTVKEYEKTVNDLNKKLLAAEKERDTLKKTAESSGEEADRKIAEAKREAERIRADLEEAQKQLKTSAADVTAFGIRFNTVQSEWAYMVAELKKAEARDAETGAKLREAVRQLLDYFRKEVEKE